MTTEDDDMDDLIGSNAHTSDRKARPNDTDSTSETVAAGQLRAFIERIERLEEEKKTIADDIKDIKSEAKGSGFDIKALNTILKLRKKDAAERQEEEAILQLYLVALGMA